MYTWASSSYSKKGFCGHNVFNYILHRLYVLLHPQTMTNPPKSKHKTDPTYLYKISPPAHPFRENFDQPPQKLRGIWYITHCALLLSLLSFSKLHPYPPSYDCHQSSSGISPACLEDTPRQSRYSWISRLEDRHLSTEPHPDPSTCKPRPSTLIEGVRGRREWLLLWKRRDLKKRGGTSRYIKIKQPLKKTLAALKT